MKLSEMNTEQLADCMLALADPVANILEDDALKEYLKDFSAGYKESSRIALFGGAIKKLLPLLVKGHRQDVYMVLSALTGKTVEEIGAQKGLVTIKEAISVIDKELIDFFR